MMRALLLIGALLFTQNLYAKKVKGVLRYTNRIYSVISTGASPIAETLTTVACGHPVRLLKTRDDNWAKIKAGPYSGYMPVDYLSKKKVKCFQDKYPRFIEKMNLSPTQMYLWGKMQNLYKNGYSRVRE